MFVCRNRISRLITQEAHQCGHPSVATTAAKTRAKYWILQVHDLVKTVKFKCITCREMEPKTEMQIMADLPLHRTAPDSPSFYYTPCDYFGPLTVKVGRNKATRHHGVTFTCLNTRAVHLEIPTDWTTIKFIQTLRRFFSIRGYPTMMMRDNGMQMVSPQRGARWWKAGTSRNFKSTVLIKVWNGDSQLRQPHTRMVALTHWWKAARLVLKRQWEITSPRRLNCTHACWKSLV